MKILIKKAKMANTSVINGDVWILSIIDLPLHISFIENKVELNKLNFERNFNLLDFPNKFSK